MTRLPRPSFAAGFACALMLGGCSGGDPILIGVTANFGDPLSAPILHAARLAVEEINAAGGVDGRPLELLEKDDFGDPDSAVVAASALASSDVVAVIGHGFSGPTLAAASVYNQVERPVVAITPSASSPEVSFAGPWTFRLCPSDLAHGSALARWARGRLGLARGAVLFSNDDYGRGIREVFERDYAQVQGVVVESDPYLGSPPVVEPYLDRIARDGRAQFVLVAGYLEEGSAILRGLRERGVAIPVLGGDGLEQIERLGPMANGTYVSSSYLPEIATEGNRKFLEAWRARYPDLPPPNGSGIYTYTALHLLKQVMGRVGTDRHAIRRALAEVGGKEPAFEGPLGPVAFDSNGDLVNPQVYVGVARDGRMGLAEAQ
ncbi:MAG: branched-chain amino acid ABC transporter substrate-binding protein [Gemmatimonadales bacterium]